jgi:hypothetical protein
MEARERLEFSSIRAVSEVVDQTPTAPFIQWIGVMISASSFFGLFTRPLIGHASIRSDG